MGLSRPPAPENLRGWTFFCNFEVKFEIRGISDENEAGNILYELRSRLYLESASALDNWCEHRSPLAYPQTCYVKVHRASIGFASA